MFDNLEAMDDEPPKLIPADLPPLVELIKKQFADKRNVSVQANGDVLEIKVTDLLLDQELRRKTIASFISHGHGDITAEIGSGLMGMTAYNTLAPRAQLATSTLEKKPGFDIGSLNRVQNFIDEALLKPECAQGKDNVQIEFQDQTGKPGYVTATIQINASHLRNAPEVQAQLASGKTR